MKKNLMYGLVSAAVMVGLPWLAVAFAPADGGMAVCLLLFFAVDPVYAVVVGVLSGQSGKSMAFQPLVTAALFLAGNWLNFPPIDPVFWGYGAVYLVLGYAAWGIARLVQRKKASRS